MKTSKNNNICYILGKNESKFNNFKYKNMRIHFVGIGGVSVSSLAIFALRCSCDVSGYDAQKTLITTKLENLGIKVRYENDLNNVKDAQVVVYSNACENSEEVKYAKNQNIITLSRAEFLSEILKLYKTSICVSGAHGKTTTTALIYEILKQAKLNPSLHLGGNLSETNNSYAYTNADTIVCEACEYKDSFLHFNPQIGIILNIAPEHLDYFKTFDNVKNSFTKFASQSQMLILNSDLNIKHQNKTTFGFHNANFTARNIKILQSGKTSFDCYFNNIKIAHFILNLIGKHNILNALASVATIYALYQNSSKNAQTLQESTNVNMGILKDEKIMQYIKKALKNFKGIERRYQYMHKNKFIVHDYAHHPDEIATTINETLKFYKNKLLVVFQPHTYSRTRTLMPDFVNVFKIVKEVLILPTYSAREKYDYKGSALLLAKNIGNNAIYIKNNKKQEEYILNKINKGYGILLLGAGDIYNLAKNIAKKCWQHILYVLNSIR